MTTPATTPRPRRRRWIWGLGLILGGCAVLVLLGAAALPWALNSAAGRIWLLEQVNQGMAPGRLEVAAIDVSWFRPTRMTGFVVRDPEDQTVVTAPVARWDRSLTQILFDPAHLGTLDLGKARVDARRSIDPRTGATRWDLYEALRAFLEPDPRNDLTITVRNGRLNLDAPGLLKPMTARADFTLTKPMAPGTIKLNLSLAKPGAPSSGPSLKLDMDLDPWGRPRGQADVLSIALAGDHWPVAFDRAGETLALEFDGKIDVRRRDGRWSSSGASELIGLSAIGLDAGLDRIDAVWDVTQQERSWEIRTLDLSGAAGTLKATGTTTETGVTTELAGDLDLVVLQKLLPSGRLEIAGSRLERGRLTLNASVASGATDADRVTESAQSTTAGRLPVLPKLDQPVRFTAAVRLADLVTTRDARRTEIEPIEAKLSAVIDPRTDRFDLISATTDSPYGALSASGTISELQGRRMLDLRGTLTCDWKALQTLLPTPTDEGARIESGPLAFRVSGPLALDRPAELLDISVRLPIESADLLGMKLGPTVLEASSRRGQSRIEPVITSINGGRVELYPEFLRDDLGGLVLRLGPGSRIDNAAVNDEVSQRVLAFVVPTLSNSTRVHGFVSAEFDTAEFPLSGQEDRFTDVQGRVVFRDVEFIPGLFARAILSILQLTRNGPMRLDQPVVLAIHDGKVHQRGLSLPLWDIARITMEGTVGFDRTLNLNMSVPLIADRFADVPVLNTIAGGVRPTIPIRGTLEDPEIDREALGANLGRMGLEIGGRAAVGSLDALLKLLSRPREDGGQPLQSPQPDPDPEP